MVVVEIVHKRNIFNTSAAASSAAAVNDVFSGGSVSAKAIIMRAFPAFVRPLVDVILLDHLVVGS